MSITTHSQDTCLGQSCVTIYILYEPVSKRFDLHLLELTFFWASLMLVVIVVTACCMITVVIDCSQPNRAVQICKYKFLHCISEGRIAASNVARVVEQQEL
jgi:hypothetical protein